MHVRAGRPDHQLPTRVNLILSDLVPKIKIKIPGPWPWPMGPVGPFRRPTVVRTAVRPPCAPEGPRPWSLAVGPGRGPWPMALGPWARPMGPWAPVGPFRRPTVVRTAVRPPCDPKGPRPRVQAWARGQIRRI